MAIPVKNVRGIGPKTVEYLATKKITTVEQLLSSKVEVLASAPGIGVVRAEAAMKEAARLSGNTPATGTTKTVSSSKQQQDKKEKKKKDKGKKDKKKDKKKNRKDKKTRKNDKKKDKKNKK
ncbi:MAG: helix-hairpin-helix domain-containing protein [Gammaproteobacteria bacterium]